MSSYPIRGPWPGRLFIISRPRGGDWLTDDMQTLKKDGFDVLVSLLTPNEQMTFELIQEEDAAKKQGLRFFSIPITDRSVPDSREETFTQLQEIEKSLLAGDNVGIHCRQGIGRSALVAASLLVMSGLNADKATAAVAAARGLPVPETAAQRNWIERFEMEFAPTLTHLK